MAKYEIQHTGQFKRDLKSAKKSNFPLSDLFEIIDLLENDEPLPDKCRNHILHGDYNGYWECHINPDWLLIYSKETVIRIITLYRTGTHAKLFGKGKKK